MLIFKCLAGDRFCLQNPTEKHHEFPAMHATKRIIKSALWTNTFLLPLLQTTKTNLDIVE